MYHRVRVTNFICEASRNKQQTNSEEQSWVLEKKSFIRQALKRGMGF